MDTMIRRLLCIILSALLTTGTVPDAAFEAIANTDILALAAAAQEDKSASAENLQAAAASRGERQIR